MKYILVKTFIIFFSIILFSSNLSAQRDKGNFYDIGKQFYYNFFYLPTDEGDSIEVITIYKIAYNLLKFNSEKVPGQRDRFVSIPQFEIEFKDLDGIIRKRDREIDTVVLENYELINSKTDYYYGSVISKLSTKEYSPHVYLWNDDIVKIAEEKLPNLDLSNFKTKLNLSSPLICWRETENGKYNYKPFIMDRNAGFSSDDIVLFFLTTTTEESPEYQYSIEFLDIQRAGISWEGSQRVGGTPEVMSGKSLFFNNLPGELHTFEIIDEPPFEDGYTGIVKVLFTADIAVPGDYKLRIWDNNQTDTLEFEFGVVWENMPISLRTPSYAAELMYYVLTDEEYEEITDGSEKEILRNIFEWWKNQDPTRFTIYNEAMAEYFKRVDYAFFNFKNLYEKDGARTDRGKIHILNGLPDSIENSMDKSGTAVETWYYKSLRKAFHFETDKSGIIFLKEIKDI